MTIALSTLRASCRQDLRDPSSTTWSDDEIDDLIGRGIDALRDFYPRELSGIVTIAASTYTYALPTGMSEVFRVDIYGTDGLYDEVLRKADGDGPNSGWDVFADLLRIPRWTDWTAGQTLELLGYGGWTQIDATSSSSTTTELDASAQWAVRLFVRVEGFQHLVTDRTAFRQWVQSPTNTDVTALSLASIAREARYQWEAEKARLRKMRKTG